MLGKAQAKWVVSALEAADIHACETIQSLWGGYGEIVRVGLDRGLTPSAVVKWVNPPSQRRHPRGWTSDLSHERKLKSYAVECAWYRYWAPGCGDAARVAHCYLAKPLDDGWLFVFEDLDAAGYPARPHGLNSAQEDACLRWLAEFHARFLGSQPQRLWSTGTYWHLETRPEELAVIADTELGEAAGALDQQLRACRFRTLVHGDAKLANFCFSTDGDAVAAVDFQYVGGGCGMQDVAYFFSSYLDEQECERRAEHLLDRYFSLLRSALERRGSGVDSDGVESEWRSLYPVAWADFHRFLAGWAPEHWKRHRYTQQMTDLALRRI